MSVTLHTLTGMAFPATHHAIENAASLGESNGILYGLAVTCSENTVTVGNGYGMICGRLFEIASETLSVVLPTSEKTGQVILTLDLSLDTPLSLSYDLTGASLTQTADAVYTDGIYQIQLATFTANASECSSPVITAPKLMGIGIVEDGTYISADNDVAGNLEALDAAFGNQFTGTGRTAELTPIAVGYVTNSKKNIEFQVPLAKPLSASITGCSVYSCYLTIRQGGLYIKGNGTTKAAVDPAELTCYLTRGGIRVKWAHGSVINSKAINNEVCAVDCTIRFTFT